MKWMSWVGAGLLVVGLVAAGLSAFAFSRAGETAARIDASLQAAEDLLREAESVKESDPARYEQLTGEAGRRAQFAELDQEERDSQTQGAQLLAAGAVAGLAGGAGLLVIGRRRARV
ncbi:hypothetical protein Ppa06_16050 [Planomonospora parontospora subsp. parontospora]|uniref:Uncharacterized protein n=2 Tax=Planomonospora parontospora TaxID=58119 RepID=A0AA37BE67_9ACTN|nr:hypothetical protein [Planomonospora parontospora]GGK57754.1 hypothetical protein GCM10010126_16600 [Planomonospora parontospora]GII07807.1 hypothetical protein Ppa06_16050 [Planomonospora parontospora subsp. parontospora]